MGRIKENYTLFYRLRKNGKKVWYYRTYTLDGKRTCGKSTGCESKAKARAFCEDLLTKGHIWGGSCKYFKDYATTFFDFNSPWVKDRMSCGTIDNPALSKSYIHSLQQHLRNYILPFFGNYKILDLKPSITKLFRAELLEKGIAPKGKTARPLAPKTINNIVSTFKIICDAALADGIMTIDPLKTIRQLKGKENPRDAFVIDELQKIVSNLRNKESYATVLTCACTGMRISEVLAIREQTIYENYLDVYDQLYKNELKNVKTKEARKIPITKELFDIIKNDKYCPSYERVRYELQKAIKETGLEEERLKRGLCIHSLRHFFNTYMLSENVPGHKVAAVMGHSSGVGSMQERYTNWKPEMFPEVYEAQEKLLNIIK